MATAPQGAAEETESLQRCIGDLVSVVTFPSRWAGGEPEQIGTALLDELVAMLGLDQAYARLTDPTAEVPIELARVADPQTLSGQLRGLGELLNHHLGTDPLSWPSEVRLPLADGDMTFVPIRLGLRGEVGMIVAGSRRADFPRQTERLVLNVAANQAALGLHEARLRAEQRAVARELEQQVAQPTQEPTAANANLRAFELDLRQAVDSLPGLVCTMSPSGEIELFNSQVLEFFGKTAEQLKGWGTSDAVHPDDLPRVIAAFTASVANGTGYDVEHRCRRADGVYRWFQVRALPLRDTGDGLGSRFVLLTDIDDRKRAEDAIRASERNLNEIINTIPALAWSANPDGAADFFNQHYLDYVGLTTEQAKGVGWATAIHPDDMNGLLKDWQRIMASGQAGEAEGRLRRADGEYRWLIFRPNPLRDERGNIVKWYGVNTDIEDRKRAEEKLRQSELQARLLVDSIPGFVAVLGSSGEVEHVNRSMLEYFDVRLDAMQEWQTNNHIHPDDLPLTSEAFAKALSTGDPFESEHRLRRFDGVYRWFQVRSHPLKDTNGSVVRWYYLLTDIEDRRQAEERLRQSELEARLMVDTIPALVAVGGATGAVERVNRQLLEYYGASFEELKKWESTKFVHPDDLTAMRTTLRAAFASGQPYESVHRLRRFDGTYRWFQGRGLPLMDASGRIIRWYITVIDIDDRKQAEEKLRQSEHSARLIADSIPGMACVIAPNGELESVNVRVQEYFGRTLMRLKDWRDGGFIHPEDYPELAEAMAKSLTTGEPYERENRLRRFDGVYRWFQARGLPLRDTNDRIVRWYFLLTDIEARKQVEEKLRRSESFLLEAQRVSATGSFSWRLDTDEITFSEELYRLFEFEQDTVVTPERITERIHPEDVPLLSLKRQRARSLSTDRSDYDYEIRLIMADGTLKYVHTMAHVSRDKDGRVECLGGIQDRTQRHLAEEALDKARAELTHVTRVMTLGSMTASIAHEVNQPLSGIITNANTCLRMLASDPPNVDGARETARRTIRDGNRASDVITRLRALFSKKETARESLDLNDATREVVALSLSELQRNRVVLRQEFAADLAPVLGDRVQLQQVILNLLINASDAMSNVEDRPRELLIKTEPGADDHACVSVRDSGSGFDARDADKLFTPFYTTKSGGMGIGLSVSRSIIENHGGRLWAATNDGPGATFAFSIPHRSEAASAAT